MECIACKTNMICTDDVNDISTRIDWLECPKCKSTAEIQYGQNGKYVSKVIWER